MTQSKFQHIREKYDQLFQQGLKKGKLPMRSTDYGFWGTASTFAIYEFFNKINLQDYEHFIDLGSGDGRVVLLASLFTKATGIEGDEELVKMSEQLRDELELDAEFHCGDFMKHDLSKYDLIFVYPDKKFPSEFEEKLASEVSGDFYVYNQIYLPEKLKKGKTVWIEQLPIIKYEL